MANDTRRFKLGNRIAPPRFLAFMVVAIVATPIFMTLAGWRIGAMAGFDLAAVVFLASCLPLLSFKPDQMRAGAQQNDANRVLLLAVTCIVSLVVLVAVASELAQKGAPKPLEIALIVATLVVCWCFSNTIYTLHYAHLYYTRGKDADSDCGGLKFPETEEPDYWDFVYFAFCLGMTFQTSDVDTTDRRFRKTVTAHCLAAFVFNLGVLAFTINSLGGG